MFTLRNPNLILLLSDVAGQNLRFTEASPFNKLIGGVEQEVDSVHELLNCYATDTAHEAFMTDMEEHMTSLIRDKVSFIRSTISATVEELAHRVDSRMDESMALAPTINIGVTFTPEILMSETLEGLVDSFRDESVQTIKFEQGTFPKLQATDLMEVLNTINDDDVKRMLSELVDSTPVSIVSIYEKWFCDKRDVSYPHPSALLAPTYIAFSHVERVIAYFLACGFINNPHDGVNSSLINYNFNLQKLKATLSKLVYLSINELKNQNKSASSLLKTIDRNGPVPTLVLNKVRYDEFLTVPNCTPETILGLHLRGQLKDITFSSVEELDSMAVMFEEANKSALSDLNYRKSIKVDNRRAIAVRTILLAITEYIDDEQFVLPEGFTREDLIERCRTVLDGAGRFPMDNMFFLVRKAVCKSLYPNSGADVYFDAMDKYQKENPNIQPREAATLAMRDSIVDFIANQFA